MAGYPLSSIQSAADIKRGFKQRVLPVGSTGERDRVQENTGEEVGRERTESGRKMQNATFCYFLRCWNTFKT